LQAYAQDMRGYQFRTTPVGNFGVGSLYLDDLGDPQFARVESSWYLGGPETWLLIPAAARRSTMERLIAEGSLGSFSTTSSHARGVDASVGVSILSALTAGASVDYGKGVQISFEATEVRNRRLNWAEFQNALNSGRIDPAVARVVRSGKFVVVAADIVLVGYRAEVTVDEALNPGLAASLRSSALLPQLRGGHASLRVSESSRGRFVAIASEPVVAAVLFKRPPPASKGVGEHGGMPAIEAWPAVAVDPKALAAVEKAVLLRPGLAAPTLRSGE
jgi:hypothetical protein